LIKDYFTPERKELANKIDAILRSDGFKEDIKTGGKVIRKYLQVVLHDNNAVNIETSVDKINNTELPLKNMIKKDLSLPNDNTNIEHYIVIPQ